MSPRGGPLGLDEVHQPTIGGENRKDNPFGDPNIVHTAGIAQSDTRWNAIDDAVDARGQRLDDP